MGFAAIEVGTVTPKGQAGNSKPRLFRLKRDKALINRLGFNNEGADAMEKRLMHLRSKQDSKCSLPVIGINIGCRQDDNHHRDDHMLHDDHVLCHGIGSQVPQQLAHGTQPLYSGPQSPGLA